METIISFILENIVTITVVLVFLIVFFASFKSSKSKIDSKVSNLKLHKLSNKEYKVFCENSKKAIINTTVSFEASLCTSENEIDDMYSRTVLIGNRIICNDGFKLSKVGKV